MELNFLGNGACFYPSRHNTSCYIEFGDDLLLIDCGETVYERLTSRIDISKKRNIYILLTHLHADHVGSLGSLLSYCKCILNKQAYVVHPEGTINKLLALMGIDSDFYHYLPELGNAIDGLAVTKHQVPHVPNMVCYGYELASGGEVVYYSGDACELPVEIQKKFLDGKINRIYQDTSTHDSSHHTHLYYGELAKIIPEDKRKNVYCMHLDSESTEVLRGLGFSIAE